MTSETGILEALDSVLERGGDADDVLRAVVALLVEHGECEWAGILFAEDGRLALGPEAGTADPAARSQVPVLYEGTLVAELVVDGCDDPALLARVAAMISAYCLVGWDTGGIPWDPST